MGLWQRLLDWLDGLDGSGPTPAPSPKPVPTPTPQPTPTPGPVPAPTDVTQELLRLHNDYRAGYGRKPLTLNRTLQSLATTHASWMARHLTMTHDGDGTFLSRLSIYHGASVGENVSKWQSSPLDVVRDWMGSPGHKANVLGNYADVGFGVATGSDGKLYWCADYGLPSVVRGIDPSVSLSGPLEG